MKIIDNVIPLVMQNELEKNIMDTRFPWGHSNSSDLGDVVSKDYLLRKRNL